jgi:transcriptional regulator with XRE-family HTH domain
LCEQEEDVPGVTADMVSKWERGERKPSRYYQTKLCLLYDTTADQLGFLDMPVPTREQPSFEERAQLTKTLSEGIAAGWTLFHIASPVQVIAVSRSQLTLLHQVHADVFPTVLPMLYSAVYRLNGAALHFQGQYDDAHKAHQKAYIAALDDADAWNMAQSRSWQAYGLRALGHYADALQVADAAVRLVSHQSDTESIRLQARLLACGAENAALIGDVRGSESRLDASERLLGHFPAPHEEFDHASWLQQAGMCALHLQQHNVAAEQLQLALNELPAHWALRYVSTAVPLAKAYARISELDKALRIVETTIPIVRSIQAPTLTQEFQSFLEIELPKSFPDNERCRTITTEARQKLALA